MMFFRCIRNSRKNKNRQPIRAAVFSPPAEILFSEFPHRTSSETFVPDQGHLSLHCQVARLLSKSFLMLARRISRLHPGAIKFCVIANGKLKPELYAPIRCSPKRWETEDLCVIFVR